MIELPESAQAYKDDAESKFKVRDYAGAIRLAKWAQDVDPKFPEIREFILAYKVHEAAANNDKKGKKKKWCAILGLKHCSLDKENIHNQYKKMMRMVHPANNSSIAAEGASKLITDAYNRLTRKAKLAPSPMAFDYQYYCHHVDANKQPLTAQTLKDEAELMFEAQDIATALRFANKAKDLEPNLQGVQQFIAAYNVHAAAASSIRNNYQRKKFNNREMDWYAILGLVDDSVDTETIKKQYKKLALLVHPDKNNSVAAEGAFKLINNAWDVLSNQTMRMAYNIRSRHGG